jgi:RNA polymerase sigma-70 factor (ECF subfamily)
MRAFTGIDDVFDDARASKRLDRLTLERQFDQLIVANGPALTRLAASYTKTLSDRDDLVQEIAMALRKALPGFRNECSERTFLFRIAHNRAITHLSRSRSQPVTGEEIEVYDPAPGPEARLLREQQAERLQRAIHRLPVVYRQVITLSLEGLEYGEIAEVLGISESNVGVRLTRARKILRESQETSNER